MQPDHEPGASPASIDHLADSLFDLAGHQHVRTIEALAAVLTRRSQEGFCKRPTGLSEPAAARPFTTLADDADGDARRAICQRIARRALRGSLVDPTRGATAVHRIDDIPAWSRDQLPIGMFGPFLFYRLTQEQLPASEWLGDHADSVSPRQTHRQEDAPDPYWWPGSSSSAPDWMAS